TGPPKPRVRQTRLRVAYSKLQVRHSKLGARHSKLGVRHPRSAPGRLISAPATTYGAGDSWIARATRTPAPAAAISSIDLPNVIRGLKTVQPPASPERFT